MLDARVATFLAVCRKLNYTHAARELNLTQSAVSQHMAFLEKRYGAKLVAFEGKSMRLTEAGAALHRAFLSLSHDESLLERQIAVIARNETLHLNVGMTLTAGEYLVAAPLARFLRRTPGVRMTAISRSTAELLDLMAKGDIDCAFLEGIFDKSELASDVFCTQRLLCICWPGHPLAGRACLIEDVLAETLVVREPESGSRAVLESVLAQQNLTLTSFDQIIEASSVNIIKKFVAEGLGVSFVYEAAVEEEIAHGSLAVISVGVPHDEAPRADAPCGSAPHEGTAYGSMPCGSARGEGEPISSENGGDGGALLASIVHDISFVRPRNSIFESTFREIFQGVASERR